MCIISNNPSEKYVNKKLEFAFTFIFYCWHGMNIRYRKKFLLVACFVTYAMSQYLQFTIALTTVISIKNSTGKFENSHL
jgi:hypothetical protein